MKTICRTIFMLILPVFIFQSLRAAPPARSVSPSRQFIIYAPSAPLRGAVSELAEQTKANLLTLLRQPDRWKTPIIVNLQPEQADLPEIPLAALRFSQTGFGLKLQLDLTIGESIDAALVERELLRAILLEMIYRSEPDVAPGTACQRNRRAFATNAVHRQFIACLKRSIRRSEGTVSATGRRWEKNLAIGIGATKRRAKLPVAHFRRKRATA